MATETERLLHEAKARLTDLHQELAVAVSKVSTPDPDAPELVAIDQAIDKQRKRIKTLEDMVAAGRVAATAEARRALMTKRVKGHKGAVDIAYGRIPLAESIDSAILHLGNLLTQWNTAGTECHKFACDVNRGIPDFGWHGGMLNTARGSDGSFTAALENALCSAGVGQIGIYSHELAMFRRNGDLTLKGVAERAARTLDAQLENILDVAKRKEEA